MIPRARRTPFQKNGMISTFDSSPEEPYKVFIVGNDTSVLERLELLLNDEYFLRIVPFGEDVFTKIKIVNPDIVLMEIGSFGKDAFEISRRIRSNPGLQFTSIVFIASRQLPNERDLAYDAGADDVITPPFHSLELKTKIRHFILISEEKGRRNLLRLSTKERPSDLELELTIKKQELETLNLRLKQEMERCCALETRLKNSEDKFRNVVNQARDGIFVAQDNKFRYINPKMIDLTGYDYQELMNNPFTMPIHPEDRGKVIERHRRRLQGEYVINRYRFRLVTAQNKTKWVELRVASTIWWEGKRATLGFVSDLTEQLKKQEATIQTEKMISLSGMAAGIAHEINNPLAAIMQSTQNIIRRLDPMLQANVKAARNNTIDLEKMHRYLKDRNILAMLKGIWHYGERASEVIRNMLQFVNKNESQMKYANLNQVIDHSLDLLVNNEELQQKFQINYIEFEKELDENLIDVPCLRSEIQKVLINVLINAVQSVSENRLVRLPHIIVRSKNENDKVRIEIEDNGSGINLMTQRRIFEPFFSTRPVGEGQGIGLSISYMVITHNHDGSMEVESDPEWGTRIIIQLPTKRPSYKKKDKNLINVLSDL